MTNQKITNQEKYERVAGDHEPEKYESENTDQERYWSVQVLISQITDQ